MVRLKEIDLSDIELKKQRVLGLRKELEKEQDELRDMLVALNLDYFGTSPSKYYKSVNKDYITDDGYSVRIYQGDIRIDKKLQENLTMSWIERFNENLTFSLYKCFFVYDSGRHIDSIIAKEKIAEKYKNEIKRIYRIIEEEQVYNPFSEYQSFIT